MFGQNPVLRAVPTMGAPQVNGAFVPLSKVFPYQSYFDSTLLQKAILPMSQNAPIIESTSNTENISGCYGLALHPDSEAPVAVQCNAAAGVGNTSTIVLKPGQAVWPMGSQRAFNGFKWGLPFGWLGGGVVQLLALTSPDAYVAWGDGGEIIFHRARYVVNQPGAATGNAVNNWPQRFPWTQAVQGANAVKIGGQPVISMVAPTRALMVLQPGTGALPLGAPASMRIALQGSNAFGRNSANAVILAGSVIYEDVSWPTWANSGAGNIGTQLPIIETQFIHRLGAEDGGIMLIDTSVGALLNGCFVDIVRYGKL